MKKIRFLLYSFIVASLSLGFISCSDDNEPDPGVKPDVPVQDYHFDLWVALDKHGGMARDVQTLVRSIDSLDAGQPVITFEGTGTEVNSVLTLETIFNGAYYYQVPVSADRFSKYVIKDNRITVIAERKFKTNTYSARKYTHAWINDNTLVIMAANGDANKIIWTKLNIDDMSIISEGTLDIQLPEGADLFTTSGIMTYRKSDNKIFYWYYSKTAGRRGKRVTPMMTAVINPATMAIESNEPCFLDCEMVGTAYGELLQTTTFIDDNNNIYVACVTDDADGNEHSHLLRINANSTNFDPSYDGFTTDGKLISVMYLGGNKVMAYARHDQLGTGIDDFSHYYTVLDVVSKTSSPVTYGGSQLGYSSGRFSSRMATVDHKAFIGVDAEGANPQIYIYDAATGTTVKGAEMGSGYYFEQIRVIKNYEPK